MTHPHAGIAAWNFNLRAKINSYEDAYTFLAERPAWVADGEDGPVIERELGPNMVVLGYRDLGYAAVRLYDTEIIRYYPDGSFSVDNGGYATPTTTYRLQAVLPDGFRAYQHSTKWIKGGLGLVGPGGRWAKPTKSQPEGVLWPLDHSKVIDIATGAIRP